MTGTAGALAVIAAAAVVIAACVTHWVRRYALRTQMVDLPGQRRNHSQPTPRGGGIGVLAGALLPLALLLGPGFAVDPWLSAFVSGALLVALVGWLDDRRGLSAAIRLCAHILAATLVVIAIRVQFQADVSALALVGMWLLLVGLCNVWNFMDGINGIAGSQTALVAGALAWSLWPQQSWCAAALALAFASTSFLPFNLPNARIFLGDVGSATMGFMLAALMAVALASARLSWSLALVLVSAFVIDAALTLGWRIVRGRRWWLAHREHTYQWLVRSGLAHWQVTMLYVAWTSVAIALMAIEPRREWAMFATTGWFFFGAACWIGARRWVLHRVERKPR